MVCVSVDELQIILDAIHNTALRLEIDEFVDEERLVYLQMGEAKPYFRIMTGRTDVGLPVRRVFKDVLKIFKTPDDVENDIRYLFNKYVQARLDYEII